MTQGELEKLPLKIEQAFSDLETRIMTDIVRRIKLNGFSTASADWQIERLRQLGKSEDDISDWIKEALKITDAELDQIFSDTVYQQYTGNQRAYKLKGMQQIPYKDNIALQQLTEAVRAQLSQEYENLAGSMGFAIRDPSGRIQYSPVMEYYRTTLDNAVLDIQSGAFSYQTVLRRTVNQMTASGLRWIDYDSGSHNRVDVAARRAVLTGFRQVQGRINEQVANDLGTDSYEVTWHVGARPTHQPWQGRVYTYRQLQDVCGLGTVTGLHGANCYHDYNAFIPGVSVRTYTDEWLDEQNRRENTPKTYNGKEYTTYEALQQQRKMETTMRKYRQDIKLLEEGGGSDEEITLKKARYQGKMQEYKAFSKSMGLPEQKSRIYQDGLGKVVSGKIAKPGGSDIIKLSDEETAALNQYLSFESYVLNGKLRRGEKLNPTELTMIENLDAALDKMPEYQGMVNRSVSDVEIDDVDAFIASFIPGEQAVFPAYTSSSEDVYDESFPIQFKILSKHGKDIRRYNENEKEILFKRNSRFWVMKVDGNTIYLEEE